MTCQDPLKSPDIILFSVQYSEQIKQQKNYLATKILFVVGEIGKLMNTRQHKTLKTLL